MKQKQAYLLTFEVRTETSIWQTEIRWAASNSQSAIRKASNHILEDGCGLCGAGDNVIKSAKCIRCEAVR